MKKLFMFLLLGCLVLTLASAAFAGEPKQQGPSTGPGPAPNSGDGIPDGPGW